MTYHDLVELQRERFSINEKAIARFHHQEKVAEMALYLNELHHLGLDPELVRTCGILHDYSKIYSVDESLERLAKYIGIEKAEYYRTYPSIIHGILGAYEVKNDLGIDDPLVFDAIYYHSTGKPNISTLSMLIYVSDAVDLGRTYPNAEHFRKIAYESLEKGFFAILSWTYHTLKERGLALEKTTEETYFYYKEKYNEI